MHIRSTRSRGLRVIIAAAAATVVLSASGCTAQTNEPSNPAAPHNKTITIAVSSPPKTLDPAQLPEGQQAFVWNSIYDTLLYTNNKNEIKPNAAKSWAYSDDALTLTLHLRAGMTFSNGDKVNAEAVKKTLERTIATPGTTQRILAVIKSISTPDPSTVVITLKHPDASFLASLAGSAGVIADPETVDSARTKLNPIGSGPYTLDQDATVNGSTYVLHRRKNYWNEKSYPFKTVTIKVFADTTASTNALQAGEVDAAIVQTPQLGPFKGAGYTIKKVKAVAIAALFLADRDGTVLKPLKDLRVRKAINMAFDRPKIVKKLLQGVGKATNQMFEPGGAAYDKALENAYPYDPAAAKKLLAEAGYPNGFTVSMPAVVAVTTFKPTITQALAGIGIKVKWDAVPPSDTVSALVSKKYGMFFFFNGFSNPATEVQSYATPDGFLNPFGTSDPTLAKLYKEVNAETDPAKAAALYKKIDNFMVKNAWNAPVMDIGAVWVTKKGITYIPDGAALSSVRNFGIAD